MIESVDELLDTLVNRCIASESSLADLRSWTGAPLSVESCIDTLAESGVLTDHQALELKAGKVRRLLIGRYVILKQIGQGGMGIVYLARHKTLGKLTALKVLPEELSRDESERRRFQREMETLAKLEHPHIAQTFDGGEANDGSLFFAMEYLSQGTLSDRIRRLGPMSVTNAVDCLIDVCDAVEFGHRKGIVHRDLKPSNLGVSEFGAVKVLDLGLAQIASAGDGFATTVDRLTRTGQVLGTVDYMAPEQARGFSNADHRVDIYSLGCTLYCLLTGHPPYCGDSILEKITAHQKNAIPDLRRERPDVPNTLQNLFRSMVAKKPSERPDSAESVQTQLREIAALIQEDSSPKKSSPSVDLPNSNSGEHRSAPQHLPFWFAAIAVTVLLTTISVGFGFYVAFVSDRDEVVTKADANAPFASDDSASRPDSSTTSLPGKVLIEPSELRPQVIREALANQIIQQGGEIWLGSNELWLPSASDPVELQEVHRIVARGRFDDEKGLSELAQFRSLEIIELVDVQWRPLDIAKIRFPESVSEVIWIRTPICDEMLREHPPLSNLAHLTFSQTEITAAAGPIIAQLAPNLKSLSLTGNAQADSSLAEGLIGLPRLTDIILDARLLASGAMASLSRMVRLESLQIIGPLDLEQAETISGLRSIRQLTLETSELAPTTCEAIAKIESLRELILKGFRGDANVLLSLLNEPRITRITLVDCAMSLDSIAVIQRAIREQQDGRIWLTGQLNENATVAAVRELLASDAKVMVSERGQSAVPCNDLTSLPREAQITSVTFDSDLPVSAIALSTLKGLVGLQSLVITPQATDWSVKLSEVVAELAGLRELTIKGVKLTDAALVPLANLTQLESLSIETEQGCTEAGLLPVLEATRTKRLDFVGIPVSNATYEVLKLHQELEYLRIREWKAATCDDNIFPMLAELKNLRTLLLSGHRELTGEGLQLLAALPQLESIGLPGGVSGRLQDLRSFPALRSIAVYDISSSKVEILAGIPNLEVLIGYGGSVAAEDLKKLAVMPRLIHLLFEAVDVDDAKLLQGLRDADGIRRLQMLRTYVSPKVATQLAETLPNCDIQIVDSMPKPPVMVYEPRWDAEQLAKLLAGNQEKEAQLFVDAVVESIRVNSVGADEGKVLGAIAQELHQLATFAKENKAPEMALKWYRGSGEIAEQAVEAGETGSTGMANWSWSMAYSLACDLGQMEESIRCLLSAIDALEEKKHDGSWSDEDVAMRGFHAIRAIGSGVDLGAEQDRLWRYLEELERIDPALASRECLELYGRSITAYVLRRSELDLRLGKVTGLRAFENSKVACARFPELISLLSRIGYETATIAAALKDHEIALRVLSEQLELMGLTKEHSPERNTTVFRCYLTLVACHTMLGNHDQAEEALGQCLNYLDESALKPYDHQKLLCLMAAVQHENIDPELVSHLVEESNPTSDSIRHRYRILAAIASNEEAKTLESMLEHDLAKKNGGPHALAASCRYRTGSPESREQDWSRLVAIVPNPNIGNYHAWVGYLRIANGWDGKSLEAYWPDYQHSTSSGTTPPAARGKSKDERP